MKRIIGILAAISILGLYVYAGRVVYGIVFAIICLVISVIEFPEKRISGHLQLFILFCELLFSAFIASYCSQMILNQNLLSLELLKILMNCGIVLALCLILLLLTGSDKASILIAVISVFLLSVADYYVYQFRGSELSPIDFGAFKTAMLVSDGYNFTIPITTIHAYAILTVYLIFILRLPKAEIPNNKKRLCAGGTVLFLIIFIGVNFTGMKAESFDLSGAAHNGYLLNFCLLFKQLYVVKPYEYSPEKVNELAEKYDNSDSEKNPDQYSDIIVIMNESFADINKLGENLHTNKEVLPFTSSLTENTIRGYALSSVYGGGTPNSEYEVLTGNTMMYLPEGVIPYQQYIDGPVYSMVSVLKGLGYKTIGMHPFNSSGWQRSRVYPLLGFDETYYVEDFPQKDLIRSFVSDQEMYDFLLEKYRDNTYAKDEHLFIFGVTMQNHGGYDRIIHEDDALNKREDWEVTIDNTDGVTYKDAEQYLTLIHESDRAIQSFIKELESIDRKVTVLFFGDHLPGLNPDFYTMVHGGNFDSLDDIQLKYTVPFFIWTNYESEEDYLPITSLNYLSNYIYEKANIDLPAYNLFLKDIEKVIPAINANGYWSEQKQCFSSLKDAEGSEYEWLQKYSWLEYNSIIDRNNTSRLLFPAE